MHLAGKILFLFGFSVAEMPPYRTCVCVFQMRIPQSFFKALRDQSESQKKRKKKKREERSE